MALSAGSPGPITRDSTSSITFHVWKTKPSRKWKTYILGCLHSFTSRFRLWWCSARITYCLSWVRKSWKPWEALTSPWPSSPQDPESIFPSDQHAWPLSLCILPPSAMMVFKHKRSRSTLETGLTVLCVRATASFLLFMQTCHLSPRSFLLAADTGHYYFPRHPPLRKASLSPSSASCLPANSHSLVLESHTLQPLHPSHSLRFSHFCLSPLHQRHSKCFYVLSETTQISFRPNKPHGFYHTFLSLWDHYRRLPEIYLPPSLTAPQKHWGSVTHLIYPLTFSWSFISPATLSDDHLMDSRKSLSILSWNALLSQPRGQKAGPDLSTLMIRPLACKAFMIQPWTLTSLISSPTPRQSSRFQPHSWLLFVMGWIVPPKT